MWEALASGGLLLFIDQFSKRLARVRAGDRAVTCGPQVRFRRVLNARGMYKHPGARAALVAAWLGALAAAFLLRRSGTWFQSQAALVGLGAAFGGAAGNLLDMLRKRAVVDFIDLRWWPVFNIADVAILAGLLAALWPRT